MPKHHKLESLRALQATLAAIETFRTKAKKSKDDRGLQEDREAAGKALVAVITFLREIGFETRSLDRLNAELADLAIYGRRGDLLTAPTPNHRPPDAHSVQGFKGVCAGVMALLLNKGCKRKDAAKWIARHVDRAIKPRTVEEWYDRYGGKQGEPGFARERYLTVLLQVDKNKPIEDRRLIAILNTENSK